MLKEPQYPALISNWWDRRPLSAVFLPFLQIFRAHCGQAVLQRGLGHTSVVTYDHGVSFVFCTICFQQITPSAKKELFSPKKLEISQAYF